MPNKILADLYKKNEKPFGNALHPDFAEILPYIQTGSILDLGGGHGRFGLYFAQKGMEVTNVDINEHAVQIFNTELLNLGLKAKSIIQDIRDFNFTSTYENIICSSILNLLNKQDAVKMLNDIKAYTNIGGINFIDGFAEQHNDLFAANSKDKKNNLLQMYMDWEILYYKKYTGATINNELKECIAIVARKTN
jgi:2-polyprenyl-3-methyl-5-hydroxy-6-metoxy-1,4-benzoquinol methylase